MTAVDETMEVGCLHLALIAGRRITLKGRGGMNELFGLVSAPVTSPYCKITLGDCEISSGVGVRTTAGHAWNREQMAFPVKVPLSCIVGASSSSLHAATASNNPAGARGSTFGTGKTRHPHNLKSEGGTRLGGGGEERPSSSKLGGQDFRESDGGGKAGAVACGSSLARAATSAQAAAARDVCSRLTLRIQVFHRVGDGRAGTVERVKAGVAGARGAGGGHKGGKGGVAAEETTAAALVAGSAGAGKPSATKNVVSRRRGTITSNGATDGGHSESGDGTGDDDLLLGECSLDLVEMVCGRAPHVEEWVPLNSEGDLRLSLNYDSVGAAVPVPGDSVVLLCLSNRLDFFPLPVWDTDDADDLARPGAPSWLWPRGGGASLRRSSAGGGEGFRVEEAGDEFFLISYPTPEGWRCAVEVHRFLVHVDPAAPGRWTLSAVRDHAVATPAAAALREAVLSASQEESILEGGKGLAVAAFEGVMWTAVRWWGGGLDRARDDVCFALGLTDADSFAKSEEELRQQQRQQQQQQQQRGGGDEGREGGDENNHDDRDSSHETGPGQGRQLRQQREDHDQQRVHQPSLPPQDPGEDHQPERRGVKPAISPSVPGAVDAADSDRSSSGGSGGGGGGGSGGTKSGGITTPHQERREYLCPITRCPMEDPAVACDGITYERAAIERWLSEHDTSPVTGNILETKMVFKNWSLVSSSPSSPPTTDGP